jgi:hypothetical protein
LFALPFDKSLLGYAKDALLGCFAAVEGKHQNSEPTNELTVELIKKTKI